MTSKKLIITGCGIKSLSHLTRENEAAIEQADVVLYLVNEPVIAEWIERKSKKSESLEKLYFSEDLRIKSYKKIVHRILFILSQQDNVCVVVYGHPLLLSDSITHLLKKTDRNSIEIIVLPAISAFDCLLADLEVDPLSGCFTIEANELINKDKYIDSSNHLIIWQIGLVVNANREEGDNSELTNLKIKLLKSYDPKHECILYEASIYPHIPSKKIKTMVSMIDQAMISRITTAYIPPAII